MENNTTIVIKQIPESISDIKRFYAYDTFSVTCRDEFETASMYLAQIKEHLKIAEVERKKITDPINQAVKATNAHFARFTDPLKIILDNIAKKMSTYADGVRKELEEQKRKELAEEKRKHEEAAAAAKQEAIETGSEAALQTSTNFTKQAEKIDLENVEVKQTVRLGGIATVAERRIWKWKVVNPNLVPRNFLIINEKMINGIAKSYGEAGSTLPGIEFFQETSFSSTRR